MKEKNLRLSLFSAALLVVTLLPAGCKQNVKAKSSDDATIAYLEETYEISIGEEIERIFYVNDVGCSSCVQTFSDFVLNEVDDTNSLVIINSKGINVDLDKFREKQLRLPKHLFISYRPMAGNEMLPDLSIIQVHQRQADTIIGLDASSLHKQLREIEW